MIKKKLMTTTKTRFEGAFIKLPSGKYAKARSEVAAKCLVVDKSLYDTIITSHEQLKDKELRRSVCVTLTGKTGWDLNAKEVWDLLIDKAEDRCSMFQQGKRAQQRADPSAYLLLSDLSDLEIAARQDLVNQAKAVLKILTHYCRENSTMNFSEDKVIQLMNEHQDLLKTKQDPFRIFRYYRPQLMKLKLLKQGA